MELGFLNETAGFLEGALGGCGGNAVDESGGMSAVVCDGTEVVAFAMPRKVLDFLREGHFDAVGELGPVCDTGLGYLWRCNAAVEGLEGHGVEVRGVVEAWDKDADLRVEGDGEASEGLVGVPCYIDTLDRNVIVGVAAALVLVKIMDRDTATSLNFPNPGCPIFATTRQPLAGRVDVDAANSALVSAVSQAVELWVRLKVLEVGESW